jgi:hypothetical protein
VARYPISVHQLSVQGESVTADSGTEYLGFLSHHGGVVMKAVEIECSGQMGRCMNCQR